MSYNKFGNVRTEIDGIKFASKKEAARYQELCLLEKGNEIANLEVQPKFPCIVDGMKICTYIADFKYFDRRARKMVVEDAKGVRTPIYKLKKKLVYALHGFDIVEV